MTTPRKSILVGVSSKVDPAMLAAFGGEDKLKAGIATSIMKANEADFDVGNFAFDNDDHERTLAQLQDRLSSQHWDGFLIGFGIRANKEYTPLFEAAVNECCKVAPETVLMFGSSFDDLMNTLERNFDLM